MSIPELQMIDILIFNVTLERSKFEMKQNEIGLKMYVVSHWNQMLSKYINSFG